MQDSHFAGWKTSGINRETEGNLESTTKEEHSNAGLSSGKKERGLLDWMLGFPWPKSSEQSNLVWAELCHITEQNWVWGSHDQDEYVPMDTEVTWSEEELEWVETSRVGTN